MYKTAKIASSEMFRGAETYQMLWKLPSSPPKPLLTNKIKEKKKEPLWIPKVVPMNFVGKNFSQNIWKEPPLQKFNFIPCLPFSFCLGNCFSLTYYHYLIFEMLKMDVPKLANCIYFSFFRGRLLREACNINCSRNLWPWGHQKGPASDAGWWCWQVSKRNENKRWVEQSSSLQEKLLFFLDYLWCV